ncbi:MAG TPA: hypothetical protein PK198_03545 [Saprospiraceae bacterium]|nr:hypothetical protein [Saprospiraceae bacterium]HRK82074.1 hypothetical protein [Saprospiraceae bacterium]
MLNRKLWFWNTALGLLMTLPVIANVNPNLQRSRETPAKPGNNVSFRFNCDKALAQTDQAINNVRARLLTGGDVWWDAAPQNANGRYVVPKVPPGVPEVSSLFAGAVWLGGLDPAGNLKVAAQTYGSSSGDKDFWPGPLDPETGGTDQTVCSKWDRFFTVKGSNIELHIKNFKKAQADGVPYDPDLIPLDVKGWPGRGNPFFQEINRFALPNTRQGLAGFWDEDGDMDYNPEFGDYPIIEIRGCEDSPQYPDEMTFWIYNDNGNIHSESRGDAIQMEVQVQAFAYATNNELNDMTFQRYKLINRAIEDIDSTFFAMWSDPDLGCYTDDYVGCDTSRSLAYVYNIDAADGQTGCTCPQGVNTYCENIPILGIDYFRGPLRYIEDAQGHVIDTVEIGMSSFTYFNNGGVTPTPAPGTTDPNNAQEYYNYLTGSWRDGSPFTYGGDAYQDGPPIKYAFTEAPDNQTGWSMCTQALPAGDRRTIQASGPFKLRPGDINELIIGVVWVPDQRYPCPSIKKLQEADDIAQDLFDACFRLPNCPDAPDVDFVELDREIIAIFTNDQNSSNNFGESYAQAGLGIPQEFADSLFVFEGYKLFQVSRPDVKLDASTLDDPSKVRLIYQVDVKNGINRIFNWRTLSDALDTPTAEEYFTPELQVDGADLGIRHTFRITEDQFAVGDRRLINHKLYYFIAVAYAHNEYLPFDPVQVLGQKAPYCEGRRNIGPNGDGLPYAAVPRPITDRRLNAQYGDGVVITRVDGAGTGENFLDISSETRALIEADVKADAQLGAFRGEITYTAGRGPIEVKVFNPLDVKDGDFELRFVDGNMNDNVLATNARWELRRTDIPNEPLIASETTIEKLNEQIIKKYGFSVTIGQTDVPGTRRDRSNGVLGYEEQYARTGANRWLTGIKDDVLPGFNLLDQVVFNYVLTGTGERDEIYDPTQAFTNMGPGYFVPFYLTNWSRVGEGGPVFISPSWFESSGMNIVRTQSGLQFLNNVDVVFTSNKDLWSRCVVVETNSTFMSDAGVVSKGNRRNFDVRSDSSVLKTANPATGLPVVGRLGTTDPALGMGWFPGYAIDVETGQRLNVFFGENSGYRFDDQLFVTPETFNNEGPRGADMMFNPTAQMKVFPTSPEISLLQYYMGGQHFVYVTRTPYDKGEFFANRFRPAPIPVLNKVAAVNQITWAGMLMTTPTAPFKSYADGLIPDDVTVKLRVRAPYKVETERVINNANPRVVVPRTGTVVNNYHPAYRFSVRGKQASDLDADGVQTALDNINVVPNPYYGFSDYETSQFTNVIKVTNLPAKCVVTIYSLDGKFIRQYNRDEVGAIPDGTNRGIERKQIVPDLEWDLKNTKGIPVASGVYLIHVKAPGMGERTIKWFGVNRKFDPSGL